VAARGPRGRLDAGAGERQRRLVRAAERLPALGGLLERAGELERERLGDVCSRIDVGAGATAPHGDLAGDPAGAALLGERGNAFGLGQHAVVVAGQPRRLGARHSDRFNPLELGTRERERLVERRPRVGVAASSQRPWSSSERAR
jgi:hypothetical protein